MKRMFLKSSIIGAIAFSSFSCKTERPLPKVQPTITSSRIEEIKPEIIVKPVNVPPEKAVECKDPGHEPASGAYANMQYVQAGESGFFIDRYENSLEDGKGTQYPWNQAPPHQSNLKAVSKPCRFPQTRISYIDSEQACKLSGKRLCTEAERILACFANSESETHGKCNENKTPHILTILNPGKEMKDLAGKEFNDPRIGLIGNGLSIEEAGNDLQAWIDAGSPVSGNFAANLNNRYLTKTGEYEDCRNDANIYDLRGNVSEWVLLSDEEKEEIEKKIAESGDPKARFTIGLATLAGSNYSSNHSTSSCHINEGRFNIHAAIYVSGFRCCKGEARWNVE